MVASDAAGKREFSYRSRIIATGIFVLLVAVGLPGVWLLDYIGGLNNSPGLGLIPAPSLILGPLALLTLGLTVHGFFSLFAKPRSLKHMVLRLFFVVIPPLTFLFGGPMVLRVLPHPFLMGFERWVVKNVDTKAVQDWLAAEGANYAGKMYLHFPTEFPTCLVDFKPSWILIGDENEKEWDGTAKFHWGSALVGHWDIVVGPPTMLMPQSGRVSLGGGYVVFRRVIKPGVYLTWSD